ncbi:hypothetical protein [Peribacillus acanthi]|uniref:hypothetical protein n=1 Tax=Peribacillus acanthi TaxID=2171554 RepID=UPI000D3E501D|nr:hypothetical protein [Peribacillus acanthi]
MKLIQHLSDIEELKARGSIPIEYLKQIETEFLNWYEAEGMRESLTEFRLPTESCMYHLEEKEDTRFITSQMLNIEYVEKEELNDCTYFRIGLMNDHQMNILFFLEGTIDQQFEKWLQL